MGKELLRILMELFNAFLDLLYEREYRCIICKDNYTDNIICDCCNKKIKKCLSNDIAICYYKNEIKTLIINFKFNGDFNAAKVLVSLLYEKINGKYFDYYITYVPISKQSYKSRKFNQCEYLAKELSKITNHKVINCLVRNKKVKIQKRLSKSERITNMNGAFKVTNPELVKNKKILIIDDVITTGATILEAEKVLYSSGAADVKKIVIARAEL